MPLRMHAAAWDMVLLGALLGCSVHRHQFYSTVWYVLCTRYKFARQRGSLRRVTVWSKVLRLGGGSGTFRWKTTPYIIFLLLTHVMPCRYVGAVTAVDAPAQRA